MHIDKGGASAKVWLQPVLLAGNAGFPTRDLGAIIRLIREHQPECLEAWHDYFGTG